eukprot:237061_1
MAQTYIKSQESATLNEEFFTVWRDYNQCIDNVSTTDIEMKTCIESCYMLKKRVVMASLFSSNEDIDDINTEYLKFGLIPHFLSELYTNRNEGKRTTSLRYSDEFGKIFIHQCDRWTILKKEHREIFDRGFGNDKSQKLNPFQARTEEVENFKLQGQIKAKIDTLLKKETHFKLQNQDTKWRLFSEDEDNREFWLNQYQIAVLKTIKTLKQNALERPLSERWEKEQAEKAKQNNAKTDATKSYISNSVSNHKATHFDWEPRATQNHDKRQGHGPKVWTVDENGKTNAFPNLDEMKYHLDRTVDQKVKLRTDRNLIFRDPNPWTYTVEQAAELGLLSEVPKDYKEKQRAKQRQEVLNKKHVQRYGKPLGYNVDHDDGSELDPGKVEYHRKGKVTTFTMGDMPRDPSDDKEIEDMTEEEYEQWLKDERGWANWKD